MRPVCLCAAALVVVALLEGCGGSGKTTTASTPTPFSQATPIRAENALRGTSSWTIKRAPIGQIAAYTSEVSVTPGGVIHLHVSVDPASPYQIRVYRMGWYQGLGARLMRCLPSCSSDKLGVTPHTAAPNPVTHELDAGWPVTDAVPVPTSWLSGYYLIDVVLGPTNRVGTQVPLIVRGAPGNRSAILVQASVNTWEAYNKWGGKSLYAFNSTEKVAATKVSFNRPYEPKESNTTPFTFEIDLVRFLEHEGYDVTYTTDVDTDADPSSLRDHKLVIVNGHDEYWTMTMRRAFTQAIAAGVNVAFFGSNIEAWQARYEDGRRTLVEYRSATLDPEADPRLKTVTFRSIGLPECQFEGVMREQPNASENQTVRANPPPYTVTPQGARSPWAKGTGLTAGAQIEDVVGYEWDSPVPSCVIPKPKAGPTVLFSYAGAPPAGAVTYTAPSGAQVFASGAPQLNWALDDSGHKRTPENPGLQRFIANMIDAMIGAS